MAEKIEDLLTSGNSLALAYLGDAVFELAIRHEMIRRGHIKLHDLNKQTVRFVSADAQAKAVHFLAEVLTEEEAEWLRRGRNVKSKHASRGSTVLEYRHATALETLMGYLYLKERQSRVEELIQHIIKEMESVES
jgi:ribonuclease-3 family protein